MKAHFVMILWFGKALLPSGWRQGVEVKIAAGMIAEVVCDRDPGAAEERHAIGLPGLCNVHSHGFQRGMAGLSERQGPRGDDFWTWRQLMYRFLDRLDPDMIAAITAFAYVEMLEAGFTHVGEFHYVHHAPDGRPYAMLAATAAAIVAAADAAGIGLTLLPVLYAHGDVGGQPALPGQRRFLNDPDSFARLLDASVPLLREGDRLGIAPHSLRAVTGDQLAAVLPLAGGGPIHIHAAEQEREVQACLEALGARPVAWLMDNCPVDQRWCLIHATHINEGEVVGLAASGAVAGLCPLTEANLGDGLFPAVSYLAAGGRMAIGTDSNIWIDAAGELRQLEYGQRLLHRRRNLLGHDEQPSVGRRLFDAALAGGAQALAIGGGIVAGAPANLLALDGDNPSLALCGDDQIIDTWMFGARDRLIDAVWHRGRRVVSDGRHHARAEISLRYRQQLAKLMV